MGESGACLVRSFSQPSREPKEGDPIRALGESISFGRFMSESLAWEKWSAFSHNRYLEEAEKSSKPGTVAQKKAYFEAQYKKIAAEKAAAAALLEQENLGNSNSPEPSVRDEIHDDNPSSDSNLENPNEHEFDEIPMNEIVDVNEVNFNVVRNELESVHLEEAKLGIGERVIVKSPPRVELPSSLENAKDEVSNKGTLASTSATKLAVSSKPSAYARKGDKATPNSKKSTRDLTEKKTSTPKSLHMSMNLGSIAKETSKISSPVLQKKGNSRIVKVFVKTSKDSAAPQRTTPIRASVTGVLKHPSQTTRQQSTRAKEPFDHSIYGNKKVDRKLPLPILSSNHMKSSSARGSNARESTLSSSFIFKSEERAAKRKELFQKQEEKINAKGAEKPQLQAKSKEKAENEFKKMRETISSKAKLFTNIPPETEAGSNQIKKIPLARPPSPSPKLGRSRTPGTAHDISTSRPPWRPSNKAAGFKSIAENSNRIVPIRSTNSLPKKKHENASPNIQSMER